MRGQLLGFAVAAAALVTLAATALLNLKTAGEDAAWVHHTFEVLQTLDEALSALAQSFINARSYYYGGEPGDLVAHRHGQERVEAAMERLQQLVADSPPQAARVKSLLPLVALRSRAVETLIASRPDASALAAGLPSSPAVGVGPPGSWRDLDATAREVRSRFDALTHEEQRLLAAREARLSRRAFQLFFVIAGGCALLAALLFATLLAALRHEGERQRILDYQVQMMGVVGHDLRSPLSAIMTSGSYLALERDIPLERRANLARRVLSSSRRMELIIRDLLDFTQVRVGEGISIDRRPSDLGEICRGVLEELGAEFPEQQIVFEKGGDLSGNWDGQRIAQVVSNLLTNALKYGADGQPVTLRAVGERNVQLQVHNQGPPIPPDLLPVLYQPFRRGAAPSRKNPNRSLGLGLYIVRQLVVAHEGEIDVTSDAQSGTCFRVTLPRAESGGGMMHRQPNGY